MADSNRPLSDAYRSVNISEMSVSVCSFCFLFQRRLESDVDTLRHSNDEMGQELREVKSALRDTQAKWSQSAEQRDRLQSDQERLVEELNQTKQQLKECMALINAKSVAMCLLHYGQAVFGCSLWR